MPARLDTEFREFMHARWPAMVRLAYGLTGDQEHAEDVAQAAFARGYASWARVRRSHDPEAYVQQIVVSENRNRFRKRRVPERLAGKLPATALIDVPWTDVTREYDERSAGLEAASEAISPHPAPVQDTVRRGRSIRRRRAALAAGVVSAAAVALGVPALVQSGAGPGTRTSSSPGRPAAITVQAPGRGAEQGEIATGTINGQRWWIVADLPGTDGADPGHQNIIIAGPAVAPVESFPAMPVLSTAGSPVPVSFSATVSRGVQVRVGAVRADVSYLTVRLDDGSVLTLHPVKVYGTRAVAFAIPQGAQIADVVAYSRHGEIGFTVPFNQPGGFAWFASWLKPGQHQVPRVSGRIASGTLGGQAWAATAYLGPWGICIPFLDSQPVNVACVPSVSAPVVVLNLDKGGTPGIAGGIAAASVARVVITQPDGSTTQVRLVRIGGRKFFAFVVRPGSGPLRWTAYDRAGQMVASPSS